MTICSKNFGGAWSRRAPLATLMLRSRFAFGRRGSLEHESSFLLWKWASNFYC